MPEVKEIWFAMVLLLFLVFCRPSGRVAPIHRLVSMRGFPDLILRSSFTILSWLFSRAFNVLIERLMKNFRK
jgi:hypothetical protein